MFGVLDTMRAPQVYPFLTISYLGRLACYAGHIEPTDVQEASGQIDLAWEYLRIREPEARVTSVAYDFYLTHPFTCERNSTASSEAPDELRQVII